MGQEITADGARTADACPGAQEEAKKRRSAAISTAAGWLKGRLDDGSFGQFVDMLADMGYFSCLSTDELEKAPVDGRMPLLTNNGLQVGVSFDYGEGAFVGIEKRGCFDSLRRCGTWARFPMTKRGYRAFRNFFTQINDRKSNARKDFMDAASGSWYGGYAKF